MKKLLLITTLLLTSPLMSAVADPNAPQTPEGKMAESAGAYLGSLEWLRVFKHSDCAYVLHKNFPSVEVALTSEILPAFPPNLRNEVAKSMREIRPELAGQAENYVGSMIAAAQKDYDRKTGCGFVAGMLGCISARTYEKWVADKQRYGWKK